jgi:putative colanic acid biosysnthesis UDP-glucose lipid carrier transferase
MTMPRDLPESWVDEGAIAVEPRVRPVAVASLKRMIDILGAGVGLIVLSPLLLLVVLLIVLESPGWPVFCQRRTGYGGRSFVIYKFRSMRVTEDGPKIVQAVRDDDRITMVGRIIRRTSIDELPQLLNVLKGEMSLVGPRPHALAHDHYYGERIPRYDDRFMAKPGLTGLAQVCGLRGRTEDVADMAARIDKDLEYIENWSVMLDIKILLRTVLIFAFHPAAY